MATKGYLMLLDGMREIERILKERMHEDEETIAENGVCVLVESMADQIDILKQDLEEARRLVEAKAEAGWKCKANRSADPPQDCDWPICGCDPYADKVIEALEESGHFVARLIPAPADALRTRLEEIAAAADLAGRHDEAMRIYHAIDRAALREGAKEGT